MERLSIESLGYDEFFENNRKKLGSGDFSVARVSAEHKGAYELINEYGQLTASIAGKQIFEASSRKDLPAVGDWVIIREAGSGRSVISGVLPRKTMIARRHGDRKRITNNKELQIIGVNIDVAFIVESADRDFSLNRFERYVALVRDGGVIPVIVLNKIDLVSKEDLDFKVSQIKNRFDGVGIILTSTTKEEGIEELKRYIKSGKTHCFLGSSGVGKSSLINKLLEEDILKTSEISDYSGRGKHTTTSRGLYFLKNGGIVMDNPGIREVGMAGAGGGIKNVFTDIDDLEKQCRYVDCTHSHEPGCAILAALDSGELDDEKYSNYISLKEETEYHEMTSFEKREKNRQFGKFIKKAKKQIEGHKY